jgi:hypothetical protein
MRPELSALMRYAPSAISLVLVLFATALPTPLRAATFYFTETRVGGDHIREYSDLTALQNGVVSQSTEITFAVGGGNQDGFQGVGYSGTEVAGIAGGQTVTYATLNDFAANNNTAGVAGLVNAFGIASGSDGSIYVLWDDNALDEDNNDGQSIIHYASAADFRTNNGTINHVNWNIRAPGTGNQSIRDLAFDGTNFYVAVTDSSQNDFVVTYSGATAQLSLNALTSDQDLLTESGGDGSTVTQLNGGGPDFGQGVGFSATPVPEPSFYAAVTAFLLLGAAINRRRRG